jgi:hypothetical protein
LRNTESYAWASGIQEFVHGDRLAALVALLEIPALEHLRDVVPRRQSNQPFGAERDSTSEN